MQDLPGRDTAEDEGTVEAPGGGRTEEVVWLKKGHRQREKEDRQHRRIRGPLSPAWRPFQ